MKAQRTSAQESTMVNLGRRRVVGALLTAYTAARIPWALAQPVTDAQQGAFLALSALLAGRQSLDSAQAQRLYDALKADDAGFPAGVHALLDLINKQHIDPLELQKTLDAGHPDLASLPRKIILAWYVGVVGTGEKARCLAYETALMSDIVKDRLRPPTYAYGVYGSWEQKPGALNA